MNNMFENDNNSNINNSMMNNCNSLDITNCGTTTTAGASGKIENKLPFKPIPRNSVDFKELVTNFWNPRQGSGSSQPFRTLSSQATETRQNPNGHSLPRRNSSTTNTFGAFHPVELGPSKSSKKNNINGRPNAKMEFRLPMEKSHSKNRLFSSNDVLGIDKNIFRRSSSNRKNENNSCSSNVMNGIAPSVTPLFSSFAPSRVSVCNSSVQSDDSTTPESCVAIIDAATNIVNSSLHTIANPLIMDDGRFNATNLDPITGHHDQPPLVSFVNSKKNDTNNSNILSEPGPYDIVCGRNSGAYNYIGNRRFRVTIEMNLQRYIDSPTREDKTNVIKSIVWMLHEQIGARFLKKEILKKIDRSGGSRRKGSPRYIIMTDKQAREKVGHALRDLVILARKEQQGKKQLQNGEPKEQSE